MAKKSTAKNGHVHSEVKKTAQESISCDACKWLKTQDRETLLKKLTPEEKKTVLKAVLNDFKIIKGQQYISQVVEYNGQMYRSNFLAKINDICFKYNIYPKF